MTNTASLIVSMPSRLTSLSVHISGDSLMYVKTSNFEYKKNLSKSVLSTFKITKNSPKYSRHLAPCRIRGSLLGFYDRLSSPNARGDARDVARSCWWLLGGNAGGEHGGVFFDHEQGTMGSGPMLQWMRTYLLFMNFK